MNNGEQNAPQQGSSHGHYNHNYDLRSQSQYHTQRRHNNEQSNDPESNSEEPCFSSPPHSSTGHDDQALPHESMFYYQNNSNNMVPQEISLVSLSTIASNINLSPDICIRRLLEFDNQRLKQQLQATKSHLNDRDIYIKGQTTQIQHLNEMVRNLQSELGKSNRSNKLLHTKVKSESVNSAKLNEIVGHSKLEIEAQVGEIHRLNEIIKEKDTKLECFVNELTVMNMNNSNLKWQLANAKQKVLKAEDAIENLKDQINFLSQAIAYKRRKPNVDPVEPDADKEKDDPKGREVPNQAIPPDVDLVIVE